MSREKNFGDDEKEEEKRKINIIKAILYTRFIFICLGKSAYLSCRVRNLGNKTVSWIRHRDVHILTVGTYTYTSDQRFQATHHKESDEWTLSIKWAQKRDSGGKKYFGKQGAGQVDLKIKLHFNLSLNLNLCPV